MKCVKIESSNGLEIRTIFNENGKFTRLYREKGKLLPRVLLEGIYVEQMKAFRSLEKDLRNIIAWSQILSDLNTKNDFRNELNHKIDSVDAAIAKGLFFAVLTLYGRCFTGAQNRKFTFDKKHVPQEYRDLHDSLLYARHNFAAHKGDFEAEDCSIALVASLKKGKLRPAIFTELQQPFLAGDILDKNNHNELIELCNKLREVVIEKYDAIHDRIMNHYVSTTSADFWKKANGKVVNIDAYLKK